MSSYDSESDGESEAGDSLGVLVTPPPLGRSRSNENHINGGPTSDLSGLLFVWPWRWVREKSVSLLVIVFPALYGFFWFCFFGLRALIEGCVTMKPGEQFWGEIVSIRTHLWDLSKPPAHGMKHAFWKLKNGRKLHYLTNNLFYSEDPQNAKASVHSRNNLVIFIHGWPDTCMLWNDVLGRLPLSVKDNTTLVALDLPGFGGSDSFKKYSPRFVMNSLFEFILGMRDIYLAEENLPDGIGRNLYNGGGNLSPDKGKVIIVAHDWGALCGYKLAAQAPQLADRFILCNSVLPHMAMSNFWRRLRASSKLYGEWRRNISFNRFPWKAVTPLYPVMRQTILSSYIFIFRLPWSLARASIRKCNMWSLRFVASLSVGYTQLTHSPKVTWQLAGFLGPNILTCDTSTPDGQEYGETVHERAREEISAESIRYYREGLATKRWKRTNQHAIQLHNLDVHNYEKRKKRMVGTLKMTPRGKLNAPATIIWGDKDQALDDRMMLEGMYEYLAEESLVVRLPKVGHWVPIHGDGPAVIAATLDAGLTDSPWGAFEAKLKDVSISAKISTTWML